MNETTTNQTSELGAHVEITANLGPALCECCCRRMPRAIRIAFTYEDVDQFGTFGMTCAARLFPQLGGLAAIKKTVDGR